MALAVSVATTRSASISPSRPAFQLSRYAITSDCRLSLQNSSPVCSSDVVGRAAAVISSTRTARLRSASRSSSESAESIRWPALLVMITPFVGVAHAPEREHNRMRRVRLVRKDQQNRRGVLCPLVTRPEFRDVFVILERHRLTSVDGSTPGRVLERLGMPDVGRLTMDPPPFIRWSSAPPIPCERRMTSRSGRNWFFNPSNRACLSFPLRGKVPAADGGSFANPRR